MSDTLESLRAEIARDRPLRSRHGFPVDLRERVAAWVRANRSDTVTASALAKQLGVSRRSVSTWLDEKPKRQRGKPAAKPASTFLPVHVVPEPAVRVVLHSPHGYRVDGLDLVSLTELLERVG